MNGSPFDVYVNWSGSVSPPCGFWGGQIGISYDPDLISLVDKAKGVIEGITCTGTFTGYNGTYGGYNVTYLTTDWSPTAEETGTGLNGAGYWVKYTFQPNVSNTGTTYLNFSDVLDPIECIGWIDWEIFDIENAVWINSTVNVNP